MTDKTIDAVYTNNTNTGAESGASGADKKKRTFTNDATDAVLEQMQKGRLRIRTHPIPLSWVNVAGAFLSVGFVLAVINPTQRWTQFIIGGILAVMLLAWSRVDATGDEIER